MASDNGPVGVSAEDYAKCQMIWRAYRKFKSESKVVRSGFGLFGAYEYDPAEKFANDRSESDLEHTAGMQFLTMMILAHFTGVALGWQEKMRLMYAAMIHDVGEVDFGDVPDDGTRNAEEKDRSELATVTDFLRDFPAWLAKDVRALFVEMQEKSSPTGQMLYCIDKIEAVLQGLLYEADGRGGDASVKEGKFSRLSAQDRDSIKVTGSTALVDIWAAHYYERTRGMHGANFCDGILRAGMEDVRNGWFPWWGKA